MENSNKDRNPLEPTGDDSSKIEYTKIPYWEIEDEYLASDFRRASTGIKREHPIPKGKQAIRLDQSGYPIYTCTIRAIFKETEASMKARGAQTPKYHYGIVIEPGGELDYADEHELRRETDDWNYPLPE